MYRWLGSLALLAASAARADLSWVAVRDAGNVADENDRGAVAYDYSISRYEVTNADWVAFLNAVAVPNDPNELFDPGMSILPLFFFPEGLLGYNALSGHGDEPVAHVTFWDAVRYVNWLHNGRPIGAQDFDSTEDGAYALFAVAVEENTVVREPDAAYAIPSRDEWYKAAFYDPAIGGYRDYPAGSDAEIICSDPSPSPHRANCGDPTRGVTPVGAYAGSPSPYGTFDQGGNVSEWIERRASAAREVFGGTHFDEPYQLSSGGGTGYTATFHSASVGFRVVRTPEPGATSLAWLAVLALALTRRLAFQESEHVRETRHRVEAADE
jgi:formylglycine-generating enzyme required for sulfatase activity